MNQTYNLSDSTGRIVQTAEFTTPEYVATLNRYFERNNTGYRWILAQESQQ